MDEKLKMKGKKGQTTILMVLALAFIFGAIIIFITVGSVLTHFETALNQSIQIGQVNLQNATTNTFTPFYNAFVGHADFIGLSLIFGLITGLLASGYFLRNQYPKIGIVLDIFVIFVVFIVSIYISATYNTLVVSLSSAGETFAQVSLPHFSFFILHLPVFTVIIGVLIMIISHSGMPNKPEDVGIISNLST